MGKFFVALLILVMVSGAQAARVLLDPPVSLKTHKQDKTEVAGDVVAFDDDGFDVRDTTQQITTIAWKDLEAKDNYEVHEKLLTKGEQWLALAQKIIAIPEGRPFAQKALRKAIELDAAIKAKVEQVVRAMAEKPQGTSSQSEVAPLTSNTPVAETSADTGEASEGKAWPPLTEGQMAAAVTVSNAFAETARKQTQVNFALYETKFFLFYSDLPSGEAQRWADLLDRMYAKMAKLFAVEPERNIWHGKALIFVFAKKADWVTFEEKIYLNARTKGFAGFCHPRSNGDVHIDFYKQPDELAFARVLVHEASHGFLHRFHTPVDIPSWINEGLANCIVSELVPQPDMATITRLIAVEALRRHGIEDLLTADRISGWQYEVAQCLCEYMIREDKPGYVAFINAIKDGMSAEDALVQKYGETPSRLIANFGESLGVNGVTIPK